MLSMFPDHFHQSPDLVLSGCIVLNTSNNPMQKERVRQAADNMLDDLFHRGGKGERLNHLVLPG